MAAATIGTTVNPQTGACSDVDSVSEARTRSMAGMQRITRKITVATSGDTYATGLTNINRVAWEPDATDTYAAAYFASAANKRAGTITFVTGASDTTGIVHIWVG